MDSCTCFFFSVAASRIARESDSTNLGCFLAESQLGSGRNTDGPCIAPHRQQQGIIMQPAHREGFRTQHPLMHLWEFG